MTLEQRTIDSIKPYEKNAKAHPKKQVQQIADSIQEFGFNQPIVVDKKGVIIVGHGRYEAAKLLEMEKVPAITLDISEEKARAYRLADNKLNESDWDMELVIAELKELSLPMLDLTGFSRDLILETDDRDDILPETPVKARTEPGDSYKIGRHALVCADSTKLETYKVLMGDRTADMVFTDPPYNVNYHGQGKKTKRGIENDNQEDVAFDVFLAGFFKGAYEVVKAGAGWYIFHSSSTQDQFRIAMEEAGLEVRAQLIWNKPMAALGWGDYRWKHEPIFYGGRKNGKITFYGDRTHKTVLDFHASEKDIIAWAKREKRLEAKGRTTIWSFGRDNVQNYQHPTQKPVELITYAIANSSKAGDIILDPFSGSGSGSVIIAAEKTERICYAVELDPIFCDIIVQRWVDYTGITDIEKNGKPEKWEVSSNIIANSGKEADAKVDSV